MNDLQVFDYNGSAVRTVEKDSEVWFVAKDVCDVLELADVTTALRPLDEDEKSLREISGAGQTRMMNIINESGLYSLIFRSNKPEAKVFSRWVRHDVLPQIRKTGSYSTTSSDSKDFELRMKELDDHKRDQDLLAAQILQSMIDNNSFPVTPETRTVFAHEVFKLVTGHSYLGMLPECTEKWYTATEIGEIIGISANMVGRIAKANGIKAPDGEANEFGRWIFSKSKHSNSEVPSFIYSADALEWFKHYKEG